MKKITLSVLGLLLTWTIQTQACPRSEQQFICPGDRVVSEINIEGTVVGVNIHRGEVAFKTSTGSTYTEPKETLSLGMGCLELYCVGDTVVSEINIVGKIIGVNPYTRSIAFKTTTGSVYTENIETVALGLGCVYGYCFDDTVISEINITGRVIAVNAYNGMVAYRTVTGSIYTDSYETLSTSAYCDTYGEYSRAQEVYPVVSSQKYSIKKLKYSAKRPTLR
jgi:hypothetical protein